MIGMAKTARARIIGEWLQTEVRFLSGRR